MFFIHHNQTEIRKGQKQRRTRADQHGGAAFGHRAPGNAPRAGRKFRMPKRWVGAKARAEAIKPLRGKRDFRKQYQSLSPGLKCRGNGFEIDLGLAGTGHARKERGAVSHTRHGSAKQRGGLGLVRVQHRAGAGQIGQAEFFKRRQQAGDQQAGIGHTAQHGGCHARVPRQIIGRAHLMRCQQSQHALARRRQAGRFGQRISTTPAGAMRLRFQGSRHAHGHAQHRAARGKRIGRDPIHEAAQLFRHGGRFQHGGDGAQPMLRQGRIGRFIPHHAKHLPPAQGHSHETARGRCFTLRPVIIGIRQRQGQQNPQAFGRTWRNCFRQKGLHSQRGRHALFISMAGGGGLALCVARRHSLPKHCC